MKTIQRSIRPLLLFATAIGLGLAGSSVHTASAQGYGYGRGNGYATSTHSSVDGNIVDVQVRVGSSTAPLFFKPGTNDRHYFQAFQGRNYSLELRNTTGRRVGVLI